MKKLLLFLFAFIAVTATVIARPVDIAIARKVANTYLQSVTGKNYTSTPLHLYTPSPFSEFYVFTLSSEKGFILVSADDCVMPILGYSESSPFVVEGMPAHVMEWLQMYDTQIAFFRERVGRLDYGGSPIVERAWRNLSNGIALDNPLPTAVSPLLTTTWNQSPYYNNLCPQDVTGARSVTGCAATACAQIMKKWNHPATGYAMHGYNLDGYGYLSANYGSTTYNWSNMPNALSASSTNAQVNAVATLMYHIGVAIEMDYSPSGSGGATSSWGDVDNPSVENALVYYFKYKPTCRTVYRAEYSDDEWSTMLRAEIDAGRPLLYTGYDTSGGHAFVFDGYDNQGNFHVNWGWGGSHDGYYMVGQLNPGEGGTGGNATYTFNLDNYALIGIEPNNNWNTSTGTNVSLSISNSSAGTVTGSGNYAFEDTIFMNVSANLGYRFYKWSDGSTVCNRSMWSTGGSLNLTAYVEPLSGDTLDYCFNTHYAGWGSADTYTDTYWGMVLPASTLVNHDTLTKVLMYVNVPGTYDLTIYTGSSPSTQVYTHSYTFAETGWDEMVLTTPLVNPGSQNFWIFVHNYGIAYPIALSTGCGNAYGSLYSFGSNPTQSFYTMGGTYACMIKAVFGEHNDNGGGNTSSGCTTVTIGDENSSTSSYYTPANTYYNYSLTETIIDASEIGGAMTLNSLSYYYDYAVPTTSKTNCTIYLQPTTRTAFTDAGNIELLNSDAVMVYCGSLNCSQGWNEITFNMPFEYDGTSNLLVIVDDNSGDYDGGSYKFRTSSCSGIKTVTWFDDYSNPDLNNPSAYNGSSNYMESRVLMRLTGCPPCTPAEIEIGDVESTTSAYNVPFNTYFNYSFTESIIGADEIGGAMEISGISYKYAHTTATNPSKCNLRIWIKPITDSVFNSASDIEVVDGNATLVYEGSPTFTQGWNDISFTNPYSYNGTGNLLVIVSDTAYGYDGSAYKFYTSSCTGYKTITRYSDSNCPDPYSSTYSGNTLLYSYRPVMKLQGCSYSGITCPAPRVKSIVYHEYNSYGDYATVTWDTASVTGPEYETRWTQNGGSYVSVVNWGHSGGHNFQAVYDDSSYIAVRAICAPGDTSEWSQDYLIFAPTPSYCQPAPSSVDGDGITNVYFGIGNEVVNNSQRPTSSPYYGDYSNLSGAVPAGVECVVDITYSTIQYDYGTIIWVDWNQNLSFEGDEVVYVGESSVSNPNTLTATFMVPANQPVGNYRMRIAAADSYYDSYTSSIAAAANADPCPVSSYTVVHDYTLHVTEAPSCMPVSNVAASSIGATTATVTFSTSGAPSYDVYAYTATNDIACSTSTTTGSATLYGLTPATDYYIRIQASCGNGVYSILTNPLHIVTAICEANEQCPITIVMTDSYGDGWNGGALSIIDSLTNIEVATLAAISHGVYNTECSDTAQIALCNGRKYIVNYSSGNYDEEVSFRILANNGQQLLYVSDPNAGSQGSFINECSGNSSTNDSLVVVITVNDASMGTTSPAPGIHHYATDVNDTILFSAIPNSGYGLYFWRLNYMDTVVRDLEQPSFSIVSSVWSVVDTLFVNVFFRVPDTLHLALAVSDPAMGTTVPAPGYYDYIDYDIMSFEATPNDGYEFVDWFITMTFDGVVDTLGYATQQQVSMYAYPSWTQADLVTFTAEFSAAACDTYVITQSNPFTEGFEDGTLGSCWSNESVVGSAEWSVATGDYSSSTGAHTGSYNAKLTHTSTGNKTMLLTPLFDASALSVAQLNFWYVNRSWSGDIDNMAVYYRTSATGDWQLLDSVTEAHSTWTEATYNLPNTAVQVAFMMVDNYGYGLAIDDVVIGAAPTCLAVTNLAVTNVTNNSVTLSWSDEMNTGATYTVMQAETTLVSGLAATTYTVNGLNSHTNYTFSVVANCSANDASTPASVSVTTLQGPIICDNGTVSTFANADSATTTVFYFPAYSYYNYSYSEVIIPANRLSGMDEIKGIAFDVTSIAAGSSHFNNCEIYMMHTDSASLDNGFIQDSNNFQLVYSGDLNQSETGWLTVTFDNSFLYDGTSNVVVAVRRNDGSWASSGSFASFRADASLARYVYNDNAAYTIGSISGGSATTNVPLYRLIGCATGTTPPTNDSLVVVITVDNAAMGTTSPAPGVYHFATDVNDTIVFSSIPNNGYGFYYWRVNYLDTIVRDLEQPLFTIVTSSWAVVDTLFVEAYFHVPDTLHVAIAVNDATMGTTTPAPGYYDYEEYDIMSFAATPNDGYNFVDWLVTMTFDGVVDTIGYTDNQQFLMYAYPSWTQADLVTFTAEFEAAACDTYVITQSNPFTEGFEDGTLGSCWSNESVVGSVEWSVGTGDYSSSTGAHTGSYNAKLTHTSTGNKTMLLTPLFDASALSVAQLNFWYVNRSWSGDIDNMAVYYRTSATGDWQLLDSVTEAHSTWTEATYNLPNTAVQVAFMMVDNYGYGLAIDDVVIGAAPSCLAVTDLTVTNVTNNSVTLSWSDEMNTGATYTVMQAETTLVSGLAATTYTVNGLTSHTNYTFSVVANCSANDASYPTSVSVTTLQDPILCGNDPASFFDNADSATTITGDFPAYSLYNYSYSEVIVPANRLTGMGEIKGIAFDITNVTAGSSHLSNCEIYMMHTDSTSLSDGFIQDSNNFQLVFTGDLNHSETGWLTVTFDNSFLYDGSSNVVVAVRRNDGTWASTCSFASFTADAALARHVYNDNGAYTIGSITGGNATTNVPLYRLIGCVSSDTTSTDTTTICLPVSNLSVTATTTSSVSLTWTDANSGATHTVYNMADNSVIASNISGNSYTVTGLAAGTNYTFGVVANCSATDASTIVTVSISTDIQTYTVTVDVNDSTMGYVTGGGVYADGDVAVMNAYAYDGYHFVDWTSNGVSLGTDNPMTMTVTANTAAYPIVANFEADTDTVVVDRYLTLITAVNNPAMGTMTPGPGVYHYYLGEEVNFSVTPYEGFHFESVTVSVTMMGITLLDTTAVMEISELDLEVVDEMLGATISITANFAADEVEEATLTVDVNNANMGYVLINGEQATSYTGQIGEVVTLKAVANEGFHFDGWSDGQTSDTRDFELAEAVNSITANFSQNEGINLADMIENLNVYPNPTSGVVNIDADDVVKVEVLDLNGRLVAVFDALKHSNTQAFKHSIDLSSLSAGTYMLRIHTTTATAVKRIVKK